jgi:hypothetical protein
MVQRQLQANSSQDLISKNPITKRVGGVVQAVRAPAIKHEAPSSNSSAKKKKNPQKQKRKTPVPPKKVQNPASSVLYLTSQSPFLFSLAQLTNSAH